MEDPLEFVPLSIRSTLSGDAPLEALIGAGDNMGVYPVEAPQDAEPPYLVYHQMEERFLDTKEPVTISDGWTFMVTVYAENPGAYMAAHRIARLTRRRLNFSESDVLDDSGETFRIRLKQDGEEDITPDTVKNYTSIALTFRGTKVN